jgi:hypothetical protein
MMICTGTNPPGHWAFRVDPTSETRRIKNDEKSKCFFTIKRIRKSKI